MELLFTSSCPSETQQLYAEQRSRRGGKNIYTTGGTTTVKKKEKNRSQLATVLHRHTCMQFDKRFNQQKMNFLATNHKKKLEIGLKKVVSSHGTSIFSFSHRNTHIVCGTIFITCPIAGCLSAIKLTVLNIPR